MYKNHTTVFPMDSFFKKNISGPHVCPQELQENFFYLPNNYYLSSKSLEGIFPEF